MAPLRRSIRRPLTYSSVKLQLNSLWKNRIRSLTFPSINRFNRQNFPETTPHPLRYLPIPPKDEISTTESPTMLRRLYTEDRSQHPGLRAAAEETLPGWAGETAAICRSSCSRSHRSAHPTPARTTTEKVSRGRTKGRLASRTVNGNQKKVLSRIK